MDFYWLTLGILAVWRLSHLLVYEDGPFEAIAKFREHIGHAHLGRVLDCFYCLSLWIAIPVALVLGHDLREYIFLWLGYSAGAILLERLTEHPSVPPIQRPFTDSATPPLIYWEDKEPSP